VEVLLRSRPGRVGRLSSSVRRCRPQTDVLRHGQCYVCDEADSDMMPCFIFFFFYLLLRDLE
jgi:hypothetical protein